jgi:mannitol operon transcriptional antiterminator
MGVFGMNQRSTEIVQLLSKEKDEITVSGFAEYFQVSQKTIRNDLKEINSILNQNKREEVLINSGGKINPLETLKNHCRYCWKVIYTAIDYQRRSVSR